MSDTKATEERVQQLRDLIFKGKPLPADRPRWSQVIGALLGDIVLGAVAWALARYLFGAPSWAALCVGWVTFSIYRAASYLVAMGRRNWR